MPLAQVHTRPKFQFPNISDVLADNNDSTIKKGWLSDNHIKCTECRTSHALLQIILVFIHERRLTFFCV